MNNLVKSAALLATLATASVGLAACSNSGVESVDTWKIGLEAPLSGSQSALGQGMLQGAQLAAEDINDAGGLLDRRVEIVPIDDAADADTGVAAANKALSDGLDGVVGPYNSSVGLKTLPLYTAAGLVPVRLTSDNATEGMGITLQPMTSQIAPVTSRALSEFFDARKVAILYDPTQKYTTSASEAVQEQLKAAGVKITSYKAVQPGQEQSTYNSAIKEAEADKPDAIYAAVYYPEGAAIAEAVSGTDKEPGEMPCLLDYASYDNGYVQDAGVEVAQACNVVGVPAPGDFPNSAQYLTEYQNKFDSAPGTWSPYTYDSVKVLADSVAKAGSWDTGTLKSALDAVSGWEGWTGSVTIEASTGNRVPATVVVTKVADNGSLEVDPAWSTDTASKN